MGSQNPQLLIIGGYDYSGILSDAWIADVGPTVTWTEVRTA